MPRRSWTATPFWPSTKKRFEYDIPILSIEDGFSEDDYEGWHKLLDKLGDRVLVIGDDLVTTNDRTIEMAADQED